MIPVHRAPAAHRVPQAVIENPDPAAPNVRLRRLGKQCVISNFTEIPTFAIKIDALPINPVTLDSQVIQLRPHCFHVAQGVVPHQIKPEAINPVGHRGIHHGIHHNLLSHHMFGGYVGAARRRLNFTPWRQPVIVAGHHLVEDGVSTLPTLESVVENHVLHHTQPQVVKRLHHLPILQRSPTANLVAHRCIRTLWGHPMVGVIPPVEGILVRNLTYRLLRKHRRARPSRDRL